MKISWWDFRQERFWDWRTSCCLSDHDCQPLFLLLSFPLLLSLLPPPPPPFCFLTFWTILHPLPFFPIPEPACPSWPTFSPLAREGVSAYSHTHWPPLSYWPSLSSCHPWLRTPVALTVWAACFSTSSCTRSVLQMLLLSLVLLNCCQRAKAMSNCCRYFYFGKSFWPP